jgi:hypothetical protein
VNEPIDRAELARTWVHAHEEDSPGRMVLRPADYPLPPSRGRRTIDLSESGAADLGQPGPDDRPVSAAGTWALDGRRLRLDHGGGQTEEFEIEAVEPDRLVVRPATG